MIPTIRELKPLFVKFVKWYNFVKPPVNSKAKNAIIQIHAEWKSINDNSSEDTFEKFWQQHAHINANFVILKLSDRPEWVNYIKYVEALHVYSMMKNYKPPVCAY